MVNKKLIIEMLNADIEKYQHYQRLYEIADDFNDKMLHWNNMFRFSTAVNARKQMCVAFGYRLEYDDNEKVIDLLPR